MTISREWQFQKDFLRRTYNREVNEYFRDVDPNQIPENISSRQAAKRACLIMPKDSQNMALHKQMTFYFVVHRAHLKPDIYGIPADTFQEEVKFRPIIQLFFKQDDEAVPDGYRALRGQISFRLMNETSTTITRTELTRIATNIKAEFATGNGLIWTRGKVKRVCKDSENGLNLSILCNSESEGTQIIQKVYDVLGKTYDQDKCTTVNPERNSVNVPGSQTILGKVEKKRRWRPTANTRFTHAVALIHGAPKAIVLIDRTGRYLDPLAD
jgi:hypothetical protein